MAALSLVKGPQTPELWSKTLDQIIRLQATQFGNDEAAVFPWQNVRLSYMQLADRSEQVGKAMLASGLKHGDFVAIMAGNCYQYIETFLGAARIGCPLVVLNNTYSVKELMTALVVTSTKIVFLATNIGPKDMSAHIEAVQNSADGLPALQKCVILSDRTPSSMSASMISTYSEFVRYGSKVDSNLLQSAQNRIKPSDTLNIQFTSGTTGIPKAAMLTHINLINNGYLVGEAMKLSPSDVVCCPPPLFHCFGLVMGFLAAFTHGCKIVFPSDQFDPDLVLDALDQEKCTALLGVPAMFVSEIEANERKKYKIRSVRTGLAAGSSVPVALMKALEKEFGVKGMLIAYGMTETSPVTFITALDDPLEKRISTVGRVMPHTAAKVIDRTGKIRPRGVPGELCTSGYALQTGYLNNKLKTDEAMKVDEDGVLWMHTGDECVIDADDYCSVTGRIKDIIIRGGENIFPVEIENRLLEHSAIAEASVIAIADYKYGEVVGAFLRLKHGHDRPGLQEANEWVRKTLGSHKAPQYIFWIGDPGVGQDFPKTGSGKHQKHILRSIGEKLVKSERPSSRL